VGEGIVSSVAGVKKAEDIQVRCSSGDGLHQLAELGCLPTYEIQLKLLIASR